MICRLVSSVDFERVLRTRSRASSAHFAVHHLAEAPQLHVRRVIPVQPGLSAELSTDAPRLSGLPVDDSSAKALQGVWLGAVVPKRHARRAVTRTLLKRQIRQVAFDRAEAMGHGLWVVRLRAPFDRAVFTSAASDALKCSARTELGQLLAAATARTVRR